MSARILIADDESHIAEGLQMLLADDGFEVDIATDGRAAWELIEKNRYAVILADPVPDPERGRLTGVHAGDDAAVAGPPRGAEERAVGGVEGRLARPPDLPGGTAVRAGHPHPVATAQE